MLFTKEIEAVLLGVGKDTESHYDMHCVKVHDNKVYATNGCSLYYTDVEVPEGTELIFQAAPLQAIRKSVGGRNNCYIEVERTTAKVWGAGHEVSVEARVNADWPCVDTLEETLGKYEYDRTVLLSVKELERLVKIMKKAKQEYVSFDFVDEKSPLKVTTDTVKGYLMPCVV